MRGSAAIAAPSLYHLPVWRMGLPREIGGGEAGPMVAAEPYSKGRETRGGSGHFFSWLLDSSFHFFFQKFSSFRFFLGGPCPFFFCYEIQAHHLDFSASRCWQCAQCASQVGHTESYLYSSLQFSKIHHRMYDKYRKTRPPCSIPCGSLRFSVTPLAISDTGTSRTLYGKSPVSLFKINGWLWRSSVRDGWWRSRTFS